MKRISVILAMLLAVVIVPASAAPQTKAAESKRDEAELASFRLNMDKVNRYADATKAMVQYSKEHKEPENSDSTKTESDDSQTISGMVRRMERNPIMIKMIQSAGLTPRDYALTSLTLITVGMAVSFKRAGTVKEIPDSISPENASFVEQNYDRIESTMKGMNASQK